MLIEKFKKAKSRSKKGFTLVELLVAMVIMSILTVSVFAITSSASRTFSKGTESIVADDVKDLVLMLVKKNLYSKEEIVLDETSNSYGNGATIKETYLSSHHLMFSFNGYIYYLPSNYEGEFEIDENGLPVGAQLMLEESAYDKYGVRLTFVPLYNSASGKSITLRVQVYVYERDDPEMRIITQGKESFRLMNLDRKGGTIEYAGAATAYYMCYYV